MYHQTCRPDRRTASAAAVSIFGVSGHQASIDLMTVASPKLWS